MTFRRRILLVFLVFSFSLVGFFSFVLVSATHFVEDSVTKRVLASEIESFSARYKEQNGNAALVSTRLIKSYYRNSDDFPSWLDKYSEGFYETEAYQIAVHELYDGRLVYFIIDEAQGDLDRYELTISTIFLSVVITLIAVSIALSLKLANKIAQPIESLATAVLGENKRDLLTSTAKRDDELGLLSRSFHQVYSQLESFVTREKNFTRFVSHELRTPLTVMKNNIDMLDANKTEKSISERASIRMHDAVTTMEHQVELLLLLARENAINDVSRVNVVDELKWIIESYPNNKIRLTETAEPVIYIHLIAFRGIVTNLIRNAFEHGAKDSDGYELTIEVTDESITWSNKIESDLKHSSAGFGLEIVDKLVEATNTEINATTKEDHFFVAFSIGKILQ